MILLLILHIYYNVQCLCKAAFTGDKCEQCINSDDQRCSNTRQFIAHSLATVTFIILLQVLLLVFSDVVLGLDPWSLVVLNDKTGVLGPGLGLEA